jgi:hypothetical protein
MEVGQEITVKLNIKDVGFQNALIQMEASMAAFADRLIIIAEKISDTITQIFAKMKEESSKFSLGDLLGGLLQTDPSWYIMAFNGITKIGFAFQSVIGGAATLTEAMSYLFPTFTPFLAGGSVLLGIGALAVALYGIVNIIGEIRKQAKAAGGDIASINSVSEAQYTLQYWDQEVKRMEKLRNDAKMIKSAKELQGRGITAIENAINKDQNNLRIEWTPDFEEKYQNALKKHAETQKKLNELTGTSKSDFSNSKQNNNSSKSNNDYPPTWEDYVAQMKQQKRAEAYQKLIDQGKIPGQSPEQEFRAKVYKDFEESIKLMAENAKKAAEELEELREAAKQKIIDTFASKMPVLNSAIQGAEMGGQFGGPWGAIIGAIIGIITESETFKTLLEMTNSILQFFADTLGKVLEPVLPIVQILNDTLAPVLMVVGVILGQVLKPILQAMFPILKIFGIAVALVSLGIAKLYNAIANAVNWLLGWLGVHIETIDESGLEKALQAMKDATWESTEAKVKETGATKEATEALRNVPQGFKIALARFSLAQGIPAFASGGFVPYSPGGRIVRVAENPPGEWIMNSSQMSGGGITINFNAPVYGVDDFKRMVLNTVNEAKRSTGMASYGVAGV